MGHPEKQKFMLLKTIAWKTAMHTYESYRLRKKKADSETAF